MLITNAFSINMLTRDYENLVFSKISAGIMYFSLASNLTNIRNTIGHKNMDRIFRSMFPSLPIPEGQRTTVRFESPMYVVQYRGPRLEEGAMVLPREAKIEFWTVEED